MICQFYHLNSLRNRYRNDRKKKQSEEIFHNYYQLSGIFGRKILTHIVNIHNNSQYPRKSNFSKIIMDGFCEKVIYCQVTANKWPLSFTP